MRDFLFGLVDISIHDLPRRSTKKQCYFVAYGNISIHDLPRRSTIIDMYCRGIWNYFNPRPPEEVDIGSVYQCAMACNISIHDLPRRSTSGLTLFINCEIISIHDLPRRSTLHSNSLE